MAELEIISSLLVLAVNFTCSVILWVLSRGSKPKIVLALLSSLLVLWNFFAVLLMPEWRFDRLSFSYEMAIISGAALIYIYLLYLMRPSPVTPREIVRLYTPPFILGVLYLIVRLFQPHVVLENYRDIPLHLNNPEMWLRIAAEACFLIYYIRVVCLIVRLYPQHRRRIAQRYSYSERISLSWVPFVAWLFVVYGLVVVLDVFFTRPGSVQLVVFNFFFAAFYLTLNLMGVLQEDVYTVAETADIESDKKETAANSSIPPAMRRQLKEALVGLMEEERIYLDPELRIDTVARMLNTNRTYISTIINEDFGKSFIVYVNEYRIREAQHRMLDPDEERSIALIAEAVGFKSHSSFIDFFKRFSGMSPSQFRITRRVEQD